ncbi:MAG: hypothetical protein LC687_05115, partial [Actinobacteria bacterium]|nr:hypothetical protein [Actinomycetota bacterium]
TPSAKAAEAGFAQANTAESSLACVILADFRCDVSAAHTPSAVSNLVHLRDTGGCLKGRRQQHGNGKLRHQSQ